MPGKKCQSWQPPCGSKTLFLFSEAFGSGEVHSGCPPLRVIFPKQQITISIHLQAIFIIQVPFPPFLHIEQNQGKKRGSASIEKPHPRPHSARHHRPSPSACQPISPQLHHQKIK